jgi:hypothetical protein
MLLVIFAIAMTAYGGGQISNSRYAPPKKQQPQQSHAVAKDPQLVALWQRAQQLLATQVIVLNAAYVAIGKEQPKRIPPDARSTTLAYEDVTVTTVADLTAAELQTANPGVQLHHNTDPTGVIHCPLRSVAKYCASYLANRQIYVAQSALYDWSATGYEMENLMLSRLGYNISKR